MKTDGQSCLSPCIETPYPSSKFLDNLWASCSSLCPPPKLQRITCCHCAIWYWCVVKIIGSFLPPSCRFCRGSSVPCQYHARCWVARVSLPWLSGKCHLLKIWLWMHLSPSSVGVISSTITASSSPQVKGAACIPVPSASGAFLWLYSGQASTQWGPFSGCSFDPMSLLQTDITGVVLNIYPK